MRARPMQLQDNAYLIHLQQKADKIIEMGVHQGLGWEDICLNVSDAKISFGGVKDYVKAKTLQKR